MPSIVVNDSSKKRTKALRKALKKGVPKKYHDWVDVQQVPHSPITLGGEEYPNLVIYVAKPYKAAFKHVVRVCREHYDTTVVWGKLYEKKAE